MNEKITFSDLVDKIAQETGASKRLIHDLLIETGTITREGLERDGRVNISGLGHFDLKWHEAKPGRNPQTGEEIEIPAHNTITFKATADLREYINRKYAHLEPEFIEEEPIITAIPPISPETEALEPEPESEYQPAPPEEDESKRSFSWRWLIIPIIIIIIAFLFWPSNKGPEPVVDETEATGILADDVEREPATQEQPTNQPELTETPAEDVKPETEEPQKAVSVEKEPVPLKAATGTPGGIHSVQPGDNLWTITNDYYKESYLWPNIYRVNMAKFDDPDILAVGKNVEIPPLQGKPGHLTEKDKTDIAEGFVEVYLVYKKLGKEKAQYYLWVVDKWEALDVMEKFRDRIDEEDLNLTGKIEGFPVVK